MAVFKANKVIGSLLKKGFVKSNSHHRYYEFWHNGKLVSKTFSSHSGEDVHEHIISKMSKQCQLTKSEFSELIKCPLTKEKYIEILTEKGALD